MFVLKQEVFFCFFSFKVCVLLHRIFSLDGARILKLRLYAVLLYIVCLFRDFEKSKAFYLIFFDVSFYDTKNVISGETRNSFVAFLIFI